MAPVSFNDVPNGIRVPFVYVEFDSSKAQQGPAIQPYKNLVIAQKTSGGSATANTVVRVTSEAQAITLFGRGSMAHRMVREVLRNNKFTPLHVMPLADNGSGALATGTLTVTGPATATGTLKLYIAGTLVEVGITSGDSANTIAAAIDAAIDAMPDLPVSAGASSAVVTLTALNKGENGNGIDIRLNYQDGESTPAGVAVAIVAMSGGTGNPSLTTPIANLSEEQFNVIAFPYTDSTSLSAIEAELLDRWGPVRQNDGVAIACQDDTHSNLITLGDGRNSKHVSIMGKYKSPTPAEEVAAQLAGVVSYYGNIDPARPFQTLTIKGMKAPATANRFTVEERDLLLHDGIATFKVSADGLCLVERMVTTYQENAAGADDIAFLDLNTLLTLSYLRYSFRNYFMTKYPRHKLAADTTRYGAGQAIITPKVARAEAIALFRQWEELGLVEGIDQFKRDLIVERNVSDPTRLDFLLPPDLVNQLMVIGVQIGFLL